MTSWDQRILQYWADTLRVEPEAFHQASLIVRFEMEADDQIILYTAGETKLIFVPPHFETAVKSALTDVQALPEWLGAPLSLKWRDFYYYVSTPQPASASPKQMRMLQPEDAALLTALQAQCTERELELAEISIEDPLVVGYFEGDQLVGVASLLQTTVEIFDIGVLTHPAYRGQNVGVKLTTFLRSAVTERGHVAQYTTMESNQGSVRVAEKCGFGRFLVEEGFVIGGAPV